MEMSSITIGKLTEALAKAQGQIKGAEKDGANPFHKSKYTTLASVWDACRDQLSANGLAVIQTMAYENEKPILITTLSHSSGEFMRGVMPLLLTKMDSQSLGSALTYARRYALSAIVGICPADDSLDADDDGEKAMGRGHNKTQPPHHNPPPKPTKQALTEEQDAQLDLLIQEVNDDIYIKKLAERFNVSTIHDISQTDFEKTIKNLEYKIKMKEEKDGSSRVA